MIQHVKAGGGVGADESDGEHEDHNYHYALKQVVVGPQTLRFFVEPCIVEESVNLPAEEDLSKSLLDEWLEPCEDSDNTMPCNTRTKLEKIFDEVGGKIYLVGVYPDKVQADFARERCVDKEYLRSGRKHIYKRHFDYGDGFVGVKDVEALPDTVEVRMWGAEAPENVRNGDEDVFRAWMDELLLGSRSKKSRIACRRTNFCGAELMSVFLSSMAAHRHESNNDYEAERAQQDVYSGLKAVASTLQEATRIMQENDELKRKLRDAEETIQALKDEFTCFKETVAKAVAQIPL
jgi:hypothetical protein